jgi:hypothetical protein
LAAPTEDSVSTRTYKLTVMLSPDERKKLEMLAEADGMTVGDVVRQVVRRTYHERFEPWVASSRDTMRSVRAALRAAKSSPLSRLGPSAQPKRPKGR